MTDERPGAEIDLPGLLDAHRGRLTGFLAREAGVLLLRFESVDDLVQGVHTEALRSADAFTWHDEPSFLGWLFTIARRYLLNRRDHWFALKRNCSGVLRLTRGGDPADTGTGPATFAGRREMLVLVTKALELLPSRDRDLVRWSSESIPLAEQAARLGLSYDAAERARARAIERLRKTMALAGRTTFG